MFDKTKQIISKKVTDLRLELEFKKLTEAAFDKLADLEESLAPKISSPTAIISSTVPTGKLISEEEAIEFHSQYMMVHNLTINPKAERASVKQILEFAYDKPILKPIECYLVDVLGPASDVIQNLVISVPFEDLDNSGLSVQLDFYKIVSHLSIACAWSTIWRHTIHKQYLQQYW